jgi:hypothetical protein
MTIIREIKESDAANFLSLCRQLDDENKFMLLEPGERKTTVEEQAHRIGAHIMTSARSVPSSGTISSVRVVECGHRTMTGIVRIYPSVSLP